MRIYTRYDAKTEVFMAVKIQVDLCWVMKPCSVVVGTNVSELLKIRAAWTSETSVSYNTTTRRRYRQELDLHSLFHAVQYN
jgi:hypothetical protein